MLLSGEQSDTSNILRQVVVPIWTAEECSNSDYGKKRLTGNMMCAGYSEGGKDACQGDSGGPMHFEGQTGSMEVIGVVSWGRGMGCDFSGVLVFTLLCFETIFKCLILHRLCTTKITRNLYSSC